MKERVVLEGYKPADIVIRGLKQASEFYRGLGGKNKDTSPITTFAGNKIIKENVPENFDEVKQLLQEFLNKQKLNPKVWKINIQKHFIDIEKWYETYRVRFTDIGNILFDSYLMIAKNRTPAQVWKIIKNLIGE